MEKNALKRIIVSVLFFFTLVFLAKNPEFLEKGAFKKIDQVNAIEDTYQIPVLVLKYFPLNGDRLDPEITGLDYSLEDVRNKVNTLNEETINALEEGSKYHGYKDSNATASLGYSIYEEEEFFESVPSSINWIVDGNPETGKWNPVAPYLGDYLLIDMEEVKEIDHIELFFWNADRPEKFHIEASLTGNFSGEETTIVREIAGLRGYERSQDWTSIEFKSYPLQPVQARYLKLIIDQYRSDGSENGQVNLYEFSVGLDISNSSISSPPEGDIRVDNRKILNDINVCDWVDNKGVREIWIWMYHKPGVVAPTEYMQVGPNAKFGNNAAWMPECSKSYSVYDYNYERDSTKTVHNHMHYFEDLFGFVDGNFFWEDFTGGRHGIWEEGLRACGYCHYPPNGATDYDYWNQAIVQSDCQDWTLNDSGEPKEINCRTWGEYWGCASCSDTYNDKLCTEMGYYVWWMQNLPGKDNDISFNGKKMINWWDYVGSFDEVFALTGRSFFYPEGYELTPTPFSCRGIGDANSDGEVDDIDYQIWKDEFLLREGASADFNCDDKVSLIDFEIWRSGFYVSFEPTNTPNPTPTLIPTSTPIPTLIPTPTSTPTSTPTPTLVPTATPTPTLIPTPTINPNCFGNCPLITEKKSGTMVTWDGGTLCYVKLSWERVNNAVGYQVCRNSACQQTTNNSYTWEFVECDNNSLYNASPILEGCPISSCPKVAVRTPIAPE